MSKFKVGDLVKIYSERATFRGKLGAVREDGLVSLSAEGGCWFHPKQCRRLKPKAKPRVWTEEEIKAAWAESGMTGFGYSNVGYSNEGTRWELFRKRLGIES